VLSASKHLFDDFRPAVYITTLNLRRQLNESGHGKPIQEAAIREFGGVLAHKNANGPGFELGMVSRGQLRLTVERHPYGTG
jgi:hypothetical protein